MFWNSREEMYSDLGVFILGAAGAFSVNVVGALPGDELLIFPFLPVLLLGQGRRALNRRYLWFYFLTIAWLLGTLIADTYADSPPENRMKGTARVIFFILDFTALAIFLNDKTRRIIVFTLSIVFVLLYGSREFSRDFLLVWKFGLSQSAAMVGALISSYYYAKRRYRICFFIALGMVILNLKYGFRSQLVIGLIAAVLVLPFFEPRRGRGTIPSASRVGPMKIVLLSALAAGAAYSANESIKFAAKAGLFDESTKTKFETQAHGDLGILVGGRPETLVAIQAIRDKPIIGHGSFPYGPKYLQLKQDIQYEHGYTDTDEPEEVQFPVIPTHSHLTMAWVESGILGGACWIFILGLILRALFQVATLRPTLAPFYSYLLVSFLWDILYSPFGSVNRIWGAFYILLGYHILHVSNIEKLADRRKQALSLVNRGEFSLRRFAVG
jgi:hypothetical protein